MRVLTRLLAALLCQSRVGQISAQGCDDVCGFLQLRVGVPGSGKRECRKHTWAGYEALNPNKITRLSITRKGFRGNPEILHNTCS